MSSGQSYPSPISSAPSPRLNPANPTTNPPAPTRVQRQRPAPRNLHTAAADLEAAFARLEQVRMSLMQLSSRLPEPASISTPPQAREQLGPSHGAIMLTGQPAPGDPLWEQAANMDAEEMLAEYEHSLFRTLHAENSLARLTRPVSAFRPPPNDAPSPLVEPPAAGRIQHRPLPLDPPGLRPMDPSQRDDGFTVLGRHIASREQQAAQRRAGELPPSFEAPASIPSVRSDAARLDPLVEEALSASQRASASGERLSQIHTQLASPTSPPLLWRQDPRRRRLGRTDTRPPSARDSASSNTGTGSTISSDRQSRLSMLSSFSNVQNFSSPVSAAPSMQRPLLFEEPESFLDPPSSGNPSRFYDPELMMLEDVPFGRNYTIRRQMTAEGTERVHNLNLEPTIIDWNMGDFPTERRRTMMQSFPGRISSISPMNPPGANVRRRGWARLDSDGNEITSEEEEELERTRTEYRIRATNRARAAANGSVASQQHPGIPPPFPGSSPADPLRSTFYGSVMDSVTSVGSQRELARASLGVEKQQALYSSTWSNPLPMPLEEMVPRSKRPRYLNAGDEERVVTVGPWASFAGR